MTPRRREGPVFNAKNHSYYFDNFVGFPPAHKRVRLSLRTRDPAKARWLWEQEYRRQWEKYYGVAGPALMATIDLNEIISEFIAYVRDTRHVKTWEILKSRLNRISEIWKNPMIDKIGHENFTTLDKKLQELGRSKATVNHYVKAMRGLFAWAIKKKYTIENPAKDISFYPVDVKRRAYNADEMRRIFEAAVRIEGEAGPGSGILQQARRLVTLLFLTGMRAGEAIGLRWTNVGTDSIRLERTETKQRREKTIPIMAPIRVILDELAGQRKDEYVFPFRRRSQKMTAGWMDNLIRKIREYSGVSDFVLHGLRHTASTIMISEALGRGAGLADIMKILGHSRISTTMSYVHEDMDRMRIALDTLAAKGYNSQAQEGLEKQSMVKISGQEKLKHRK
jgi:integrase